MSFWSFSLDTYCRWTAWLNSDTGGIADKETLSALFGKYEAYACMKPLKIMARVAATKVNATLNAGPQTYANLDTTVGFQCLKSMQADGSNCLDYEVQLCCPGNKIFPLLCPSYIWYIYSYESHNQSFKSKME